MILSVDRIFIFSKQITQFNGSVAIELGLVYGPESRVLYIFIIYI